MERCQNMYPPAWLESFLQYDVSLATRFRVPPRKRTWAIFENTAVRGIDGSSHGIARMVGCWNHSCCANGLWVHQQQIWHFTILWAKIISSWHTGKISTSLSFVRILQMVMGFWNTAKWSKENLRNARRSICVCHMQVKYTEGNRHSYCLPSLFTYDLAKPIKYDTKLNKANMHRKS